MSRKISNILVICSLVAVLALLITGTTLATYHSIGNTVTAKVVYVNDVAAENADQTDAYAKVFYSDSNNGTEITITKAHTQTTTLTPYYNATAYTFVGWYEGNEATYNSLYTQKGLEALIADGTIVTDVELEVSMEEDSTVLAIYQVNTYSEISYSYYADPTDTSVDPISGSDTDVKYGAELKGNDESLAALKEAAVSGYVFSGWKVTVTVDGTPNYLNGTYSYATFDLSNFSGEISAIALSDPWGAVATATVTIDGVANETGANSSIEVYASENYEYTLDNLYALIGIDRVAGYTYTLKDANGNEITDKITFTGDTTLTFSKTAIEYSATVSGTDATYKTSDAMTLTIENVDDLFTASNWTGTYSFWTVNSVTSITYDGSAYTTGESLIAALAGVDTQVELTATLDVTKWFSSISMTNSTTAYANADAGENYNGNTDRYTSYLVVKSSNSHDYTPSLNVSSSTLITDVVDLSDGLCTTISGTKYNVNLYMFYVTISGSIECTITLDYISECAGDADISTLTFNDFIVALMAKINAAGANVPSNSESFTITTCKLCYVTTSVAE